MMNTKIKYAIIGLISAVLILTIISFQTDREIVTPPSAIIKINGKEQISEIGTYCWMGFWKAVCADSFGIPTPDEPLSVSSPFTVHLSLPLKEPPQDLQIIVIRVKEDDKIESNLNGFFIWQVKGENMQEVNYSNPTPQGESDINLSLESGLYVLEVYPRWNEKGSVSYGFLLKVQ
jgi:hypothetical protein